jgi:iron-regulated transporter 1
MTAWGDRLWSFGAGIFMNLLAPENLRLVAIYGFATSVSVIVFGAVIGAWIDRTSRLTAAKTFLVIQNLVVAIW